MNGYQTLGDLTTLIATAQSGFAYPEFAVLTPVLGDGTSDINVVLQSAALSIRRCAIAWAPLTEAEAGAIRDYAESKDQVLFIDNDVERTVVVMDYAAQMIGAEAMSVSVTLLEFAGPDVGS